MLKLLDPLDSLTLFSLDLHSPLTLVTTLTLAHQTCPTLVHTFLHVSQLGPEVHYVANP